MTCLTDRILIIHTILYPVTQNAVIEAHRHPCAVQLSASTVANGLCMCLRARVCVFVRDIAGLSSKNDGPIKTLIPNPYRKWIIQILYFNNSHTIVGRTQ